SGATAMAAALSRDSATAEVGDLCFGIVSFQRGYLELAWQKFASTPRDLWSRFAPSEYVRAGVDQDLEAVLRKVKGLVDQPPVHMNVKRWMDVLEPVFGAGEMDLAEEIFAALDAAMARQPRVNEKLAVRRDWIRRWIDRSPDSPTAPEPDADVSFAIMDYDHPGRSRASANIGDHVQTLASLGHLVRHQDISYQGPQDLVDLVTQLRGRVRPDSRRTGHGASVQVMTVDRDASMYHEVPEGTWTLAFGWYMHALFGVRFGFPFHKNLQPIFVSFHCNKRGLLTPEAIEYLRAHGPIGCRDWTTVDILLSVDVPAFFSGCLTTTVNTVFPDLPGAFPASAPIAYVDSPDDAPPGAVQFKHSSDAVRFRSFTGNMFEAVDLLETYRRDHSALVTSRLHCYLPMRSIGAKVDFRPKNRSDIRFAGLIDITDEQFDAIRGGINDRLEKVFGAILDGGSREEVYALWRELCAEDVALARRRRAAAPAGVAQSTDVSDEIRRAIAGSRTVGVASPADAIQVAIRVDEPRAQPLNVMVESLVSQASRPLHLWLLDGTEEGVDLDEVARRAEGSTLTVVPTKGLGADLRGLSATGRKRSRSGFDVLVLPALLPDVDRVVVLPLAALVEGDVAELADLDLAGQALAAPDVAGNAESSGFGVIHNAGTRLSTRTTVATELRRRAHAKHAFDFTAFEIDVLVLDLARLRKEDVVLEAVQLVEEFGLNAREVLHFHVGPARAVVPSSWHVVPTRNHADAPALLHWVDEAKPWTSDYAPEQELWLDRRRQMRQRLAARS
ncbi:MAG: glycosyltransferase, partial [Marmoricola sp.]